MGVDKGDDVVVVVCIPRQAIAPSDKHVDRGEEQIQRSQYHTTNITDSIEYHRIE